VLSIDPATAQDEVQQALLDSLLYSVSHDLRSPLLTMSLSAELLEDALARAGVTSEGGTVALSSLRQGAADLDRMLQALMQISRARRKVLEPARGALALILGGYHVTPEDSDALRRVVLVDPLHVRDALDAVAGEGPLAVRLSVEGVDDVAEGGRARLEFEAATLEHGPTPLHALTGSLKQYAGTPIEALAFAQVLIERQGGAIEADAPRVSIALPLAGGTAS